ncbi:hypothetical protein ACRRTK_019032 [Alexandromys fortis]
MNKVTRLAQEKAFTHAGKLPLLGVSIARNRVVELLHSSRVPYSFEIGMLVGGCMELVNNGIGKGLETDGCGRYLWRRDEPGGINAGVTKLAEDNTFSNFILLKNLHTPTIQVSIFKEKEDKGNGRENKKERGVNSELVAVATQTNMSDMNRVTARTARKINVCSTKTMNVKDIIHFIQGFFFLYMDARTTWIREILDLIYNNGGVEKCKWDAIYKRVPFMEFIIPGLSYGIF